MSLQLPTNLHRRVSRFDAFGKDQRGSLAFRQVVSASDRACDTFRCSFPSTGILNIARTPLGRLLMRNWFLRPSLDLDLIEARQAAVECFLRSANRE